MNKVAIITDTDCSLPFSVTDRYGIQQVPIIIQFGDESFRDMYDLDCEKVFNRIDKQGKFPSTSAPSPGAFAEAYKKAFANGADSVLCLTVSSALSATYQAALNAKEELPGAAITVVDTFSLSVGQGFQVLAAAETLEKGGTLDDAVSAAMKVKEKTHLYMALATLKYLAMSGRVTYLRALLGNMLDMRPILTIQNGKLELLERTRSEKKAWGRVIELTAEKATGHQFERVGFVHVDAAEPIQRFAAQFADSVPYSVEPLTSEVNPGLSIHSGRGVVGVGVVLK